jgi:exonuclease 1
MGIQGLLPKLKSVTERVHLSALSGKTVAIDAYCLLHKGAYSCSRELVEGIETDKCVRYCMRRIDELIHVGVTPYVVFDGGPLPNKKEEEDARYASRKEHRDKARALWRQGSTVASMEYYQRAVDITPEIAHGLVQELQRRGIQYVVAPYEADAQCAYLAHQGIVDAVLTEDSDLLAYGCPHVLFKFDGVEADQVKFADLAHCRELSFVGWDLYLFQQMCVMAGCDFVKALPGIGIKKAHAHIRRTRNIKRAIRGLKFDGVQVPPEYDKKIQRALWTFKYQRVYCPRRKAAVHLHEIPKDGLDSDGFVPRASVLEHGEQDFLGKEIPAIIAQGIAEGRTHPFTWVPFDSVAGRSVSTMNISTLSSGHSRVSSMVALPERKRYRKESSELSLRPIQSCDTTGHSLNNYIRKPNGQLVAPLGSLKRMLNKALFNTSSSCVAPPAVIEDSPEVVKEAEPLFSPMWRPKQVDHEHTFHSPVPSSPENKKQRADNLLHNSPTTPGIYLPESYESPENNTFGLYGFGQDCTRLVAADIDAGIHQNRKKYYASVSREAEESLNALEKSTKNIRHTSSVIGANTQTVSDNKENPFSSFFFSNTREG